MAAKRKATYQKFVTPVGTARYPKLSKPDTTGQYADGKYKTDLVFDEVGMSSMMKMLNEFAAKTLPDVKNPKLPVGTSKDGATTYIKFKGGLDKETGLGRKPSIMDAKRNPIPADVIIGAGSKLKLAGSMADYANGPNKGVTIYLEHVQVLELVEGSDVDGANRFNDEDGFTVSDVTETASEAFDNADALKL